MDRRHKGCIGEQKVILRALEKGWNVNVPLVPCRYDLLLDNAGALYRTQVKYTETVPSAATGSLVVDLRRRGEVYSNSEVDLLLVYIPAIDKVLVFEPEQFCGKSILIVRLKPTRNSQKSGVRLVEDHVW